MQRSLYLAMSTAVVSAIASFPTAAQDLFRAHFVDTYDEMCGDDNSDDGCAEISAFDSTTSRLFTTNGRGNALRVLVVNEDNTLQDVMSLSLAAYGAAPNSVATFEGTVAVAMEAENRQAPGTVVLFDTQNLDLLGTVTTGALPDMLTFTPDGRYLLVANEGEPDDDYLVDPEGSITVIDVLTLSTRTADFSQFNTLADPEVRIFGPGATVAQDLEPEYIAVSADSSRAWISLQENNALAILDIESATITDVKSLGYKNHSLTGNEFDASDRDGGPDCLVTLGDDTQCVIIRAQPTLGMYQPDAITTYSVEGQTYIVSANEGDARDYDGYSEERRVGDEEYKLDMAAFPDAEELKNNQRLGRLKTTSANGDVDGDGDFDVIYSFGARSFSIWNEQAELVFDSSADFEVRLAELEAQGFEVWTDARSDDKGPEPEAVTVGMLGGRHVAFIALERTSGVFAYDVSKPTAPEYLGYIDINGAGDISPESLVYVSRDDHTGLLAVTSEVSNTTTLWQVSLHDVTSPNDGGTLQITGNDISWNSNDYYQVQDAITYSVLCEGKNLRGCEVVDGLYNVINHTTGQRYENIVVNQ